MLLDLVWRRRLPLRSRARASSVPARLRASFRRASLRSRASPLRSRAPRASPPIPRATIPSLRHRPLRHHRRPLGTHPGIDAAAPLLSILPLSPQRLESGADLPFGRARAPARALLAGRNPYPRRRPRWKHTPDLKYVLIVLRADDNGEGGTFVLYSLICRRVRAGLLPGGDELTGQRDGVTPASVSSVRGARERHRVLQRLLLLLALLGTCMVIGDGVLTPAALLTLVSPSSSPGDLLGSWSFFQSCYGQIGITMRTQ